MPRYATVEDVRDAIGADSSVRSDAVVQRLLEKNEFSLEEYLNAVFMPTRVIDIFDGQANQKINLPRTPVLRVTAIQTDNGETTLQPAYLNIKKQSGMVYLTGDSARSYFAMKTMNTSVEYWHGWLEEAKNTDTGATTETTLSSAKTLTNGATETSVTLTVADATNFSAGDYVKIWGIDGNEEVAIIDSISVNDITFDYITRPHASGSYVTKLQTPTWFKQLVAVVTGISVVASIVGAQFDEITGYEIGDIRVQKGEPYTQWRETLIRLVDERDQLLKGRSKRWAFG